MIKSTGFAGYLKLLPMVLCLVGALVVIFQGDFSGIDGSGAIKWKTLNFQSVITSLPAVLFAFGGYLVAGTLGDKIENPEKNISKSITIGVLVVSGIYLLISLFLLINEDSQGKIIAIFNSVILAKFMCVVLFVVALGSVVIFGTVNFQTNRQLIENGEIMCFHTLTKLNAKKEGLGTFLLGVATHLM